jgi:FkbM family methyltransferase
MGTLDPRETAQMLGHLGPGMTFANVGYYTLLAARAVGPGGRVFAIEPGPYAYRGLESLVRENALTQVSVHPIGLADRAGDFDIFEPGEASDNYSPTMVPNPGWRPVRVPIRRLDD